MRFSSRNGASINDMWNLTKSFANMISIRGNDCSRGMDNHVLEDKYPLISLIKLEVQTKAALCMSAKYNPEETLTFRCSTVRLRAL